MSLIPRRGPGRHDQPALDRRVAVHPGWTLAPPSVTEPSVPAEQPVVTEVPASRWTSHPPLPAQPVAAQPPSQPSVQGPIEQPSAPVAAMPYAPQPPSAAAAAAPAQPSRSWEQDWAAVAATPAPVDAPATLHSAAVAAIDALFGTRTAAPPAWTAAPVGLEQRPHPAPLPPQVLTPPVATPVLPETGEVFHPGFQPTPLDDLARPLTPADTLADTPLAAAAARATAQPTAFVPPVLVPPTPQPTASAITAPASPTVAPSPAPAQPTVAPSPTTTPPTVPPPTRAALPAATRRLVEHAIRTAPTLPPPRRSTVRLGFSDASVIDLRPDDPIARALHTVADALLSRDRP